MNRRAWLHTRLAAFLCALSVCAALKAEEPDPLKPALEGEQAHDGLVTWWLISGVQKIELAAAKPPLNARENEDVPERAGKWRTLITPPDRSRYVDLKPFVNTRNGVIWASVRVRSQKGGARKLRVGSFCALKVFCDGQPVLAKAQPQLRDDAEAEFDIPKGDCELTVGVQIRSGFAAFQFNMTEGKALGGLPRPVAGDKLLLATKKGADADPGDAAARGALFVPSESFVQPGQTVKLALAMQGSLPLNLGPVEPIFKDAAGKQIGKPVPARTLAEVAKAHWQVEYSVPKDVGFAHEVSVDLKAGDKVIGTRKLSLFSVAGLRDVANQLDAEIKKQAAETGKQFPNAMLSIEKLRLFIGKIESGEEYVNRDLGQTLLNLIDLAKISLKEEAAEKDVFAGKTGYFERSYISAIDEQPQPYFVNVPPSVIDSVEKKDGRKFPLVIFLHGYVPSYDKHRWWDEMPDFNESLERHDCLLAIPFGRSNTDFQSCGEVDVMDVLAEMKRLYPVDDSRVYIYGYSMGGMGVYTVAAHHPDAFAAGIVFCGRADNPLQNFKPLEKFHPFKQWLIHADNPISQCENLINVPLRIYHGKDDVLINISEARRMQRRLKEVGGTVELIEMNGDHWSGFDLMGKDDIIEWLLAHKREAAPPRRTIKAYSLKHATQGEISVRVVKGELKPIELEWNPPATALKKPCDQIVSYQIGGAPVAGGEEPKGLHKTPELCGPVREAICSPFIIVYGTTGDDEANKQNKERAEKFAQEWYAFTRSRAIIKADKDVTDEEKAKKNLFLFGQENENSIHAAAAKDLPISVKENTVTIGDKKYPLANRGLMYIYPNPLNASKTSLVICAGIPYGRDIGMNHKLDLVPDFLLYEDGSMDDSTGTNRFVSAGFFDGEWKFNPSLMWQDGK